MWNVKYKDMIDNTKKEEFLKLYEQGLSDKQIGEILCVSRHDIGKYRRYLGLQSTKDKACSKNKETLQVLESLFKEGKSNGEIAKIVPLSSSYICQLRNQLGYKAYDCRKLTQDKIDKLILLHKQGLLDSYIAQELNVSTALVHLYRKKLGLNTKFTYDTISKIHREDFEPLFYAGKSDQEIADTLGVSVDGIYGFRQRNSYFRESYKINKGIPLTQINKEVLIGTLLGDASLTIGKNCVNPRFSCSHCPAQLEYLKYKTNLLSNLGAKIYYSKRLMTDKRTNKVYENYCMSLPANPELLPFLKAFYPERKKVIPMSLMSDFTPLSLSIMFMDDGYKTTNSYAISTNCFSLDDIKKFRIFLLDKYDLETSVMKTHVLYIRAESRDTFTELIKPYICDCMKYKLHQS